MAPKVKAKPDQYHTLTASLTIKGADKAIEWYTKVFDAKLLGRMGTPDGKSVWHAELRIGDSILMLNDEDESMAAKGQKAGAAPHSSIWVYLEDVDGRFARAVAAGAKPNMPPMDMFWGDRFGQFTDPFGHVWAIATHTEDVPDEQMEARGREWAAKMAAQKR
ncbi:MAG: VOC family protein [Thermoplasmata archaeon]